MLKFLPVGFAGLMMGGLIAANSSTILTHLNWGSSYLVHDFYRRFIAPDADEKHYVMVGRLATVGLYVVAALLSLAARVGAGGVRDPHLDRRRHRAALPAALVLVADQRVDRSGRDGQLVRRLGRLLRPAEDRERRCRSRRRSSISVAFTTICWLIAAYRHAADEPRAADRVLPEGAPVRARAGAAFARRRASARPKRRGTAIRMGKATRRLDRRLPDDLVVALRDRQLPLRPHAARADPHRGLRRQRHHAARRRQHAVGPETHCRFLIGDWRLNGLSIADCRVTPAPAPSRC